MPARPDRDASHARLATLQFVILVLFCLLGGLLVAIDRTLGRRRGFGVAP